MTLTKVINYYKEKKGYLKQWELNKILDKYNYDKKRLFRETKAEMNGVKEAIMHSNLSSDLMNAEEFHANFGHDFIFKGEYRGTQIEVVIEVEDVDIKEYPECYNAVLDMMDTIGLLDFETTTIRDSSFHKNAEKSKFSFMVTAYTNEDEDRTQEDVLFTITEYCSEFFSEFVTQKSDNSVQLIITNWREPK